MNEQVQIPKPGNIKSGTMEKLRSLEIGQSCEIERKCEPGVYSLAGLAGIKVVVRRNGSTTHTTVYRVA